MRDTRLTPAAVLTALELFGPQARPYNFDDVFDCWGLVRRVVDWLDGGDEINDELAHDGDDPASPWRRFGDPGELVPGDLLVSHPHPHPDFHTVFSCGRVGQSEVVYDSSSRGRVPLFGDGDRWLADRPLFTRYMRATETTKELRNDGGAYLRLWDDRMHFYHAGWHARLVAGGAGERDLVALRRAAGLSPLPFYCRGTLPRDEQGREVYDNVTTRRLDYYVPDGAPVGDDDYEACGATGAGSRRPPAPAIVAMPGWPAADGPLEVRWRYADPAAPLDGCRIEVWEETRDLWRHRLLREDHEQPLTSFAVPPDLVHPGSRFAVVVYAHAAAGFSGSALAPFLYRPAPDDPLLSYNPHQAFGLAPDAGEVLEPSAAATLRWRVYDAERQQKAARVEVYRGGCLGSGAPLVLERVLDGREAAERGCVIPAGLLSPGGYHWYVMVWNAAGVPAFAPAEGLFTVAGKG